MNLITRSFLTAMVVFVLGQVASAQTVNKGAWMIGGSAGFKSDKPKGADATTTLNISPNVGYYLMDDLAIGLGLTFADPSSGQNSLNPFARYYVFNPVFVQAEVGLGLDDGAGTSFKASVGYSMFLNNSVALEPALFYSGRENFSSFGLSIGVQAFLGRNAE